MSLTAVLTFYVQFQTGTVRTGTAVITDATSDIDSRTKLPQQKRLSSSNQITLEIL